MTLFTKKISAGAADDAAPLSGKGGNAPPHRPGGTFLLRLFRYGTVCLRPCYRDTDLREETAGKSCLCNVFMTPQPLPHFPHNNAIIMSKKDQMQRKRM